MKMPNFNILRHDGPVDHLVLRPLGLQRCPPATRASEVPRQVDIDAYLHHQAPSFDKFIVWQKDNIKSSQQSIKAAQRARDAAEFKLWVSVGTLLPATGFLATTYAMMFTFPFIVPGAILFATTSVFIAVIIGFAQRANSQYTEANDTIKQATWVLKEQQKAHLAAESTFRRLQAQFPEDAVVPPAQSAAAGAAPAAPARPVVPPQRGRAPRRRPPSLPRAARAVSPATSSGASTPSVAPLSTPSSVSSASSCAASPTGWFTQAACAPTLFRYGYGQPSTYTGNVDELVMPSAQGAQPVPDAATVQQPSGAPDEFDAGIWNEALSLPEACL